MKEHMLLSNQMKDRSRALRNNMTRQESKLWYEFLKFYRPHFRRQYIIGQFIADFYCPKAKLIIELDGSQHYSDFREYSFLFIQEKACQKQYIS